MPEDQGQQCSRCLLYVFKTDISVGPVPASILPLSNSL
uniref:Uncharacterized protein n=1 Tax=Heterorhabditis bacteriophora TaxID=37862 RepID=A0A1I7XCG7_HETBA